MKHCEYTHKKKKNFKDKINLAYHKGLKIGLYKKNII